MTDFTQNLIEGHANNIAKDSNSEFSVALKQKKADDAKRQQSKFQSAYDQTDLSSQGPSLDDYDYEASYNEGNTFKPDADGGTDLPMSGFKRGGVQMMGYDLSSEKKYTEKYKDDDGLIAQGVKGLKQRKFNSKTGAHYGAVDDLSTIAKGIIKEGGTIEDFLAEAKGPWSMDQLVGAYHSVDTTNRTMDDIDTIGKRFIDNSQPLEVDSKFTGLTLPEEPYTEESLSMDKQWQESGRRFLSHFRDPAQVESLNSAQVDKAMKATMAMSKWNLPLMMFFANEVIESKDPVLATDYLNMMDQYDHMETSMPSVGRAMAGFLGDPFFYATYGGGYVVTSKLASMATKEGVKSAIRAIVAGTAYDAAVSGFEGSVYDYEKQKVEVAANKRGEVDKGQVAMAGGISAGISTAIGLPINLGADKTARQYVTNKGREAFDWLKDIDLDFSGPMPGSPKAQRGSIGFPPDPVTHVESNYALQDWLSSIPEGSKVTTIRQKIKEGINKGAIKPEEVEWSGIEKYLDRAEKSGAQRMSKDQVMNHIKANTPKPKLYEMDDVGYPEYSLMSRLSNYDPQSVDASGFEKHNDSKIMYNYKEKLVLIPTSSDEVSPWSGGHFQSPDHKDQPIAHIRTEGAELGGGKGTMVLEIQSDYHKAGQKQGYKGGVPKLDFNTPNWRVISDELTARGINPADKNALAKIWDALPEGVKNDIQESLPEQAPFGKTWDTVTMKLQIQDSINQGDQFLAWPSNADQVSTIEQWGTYSNDGIIKRSTTDRVKEMEKLGFKVEQVDMPQYAEATVNVQLDALLEEPLDEDFVNNYLKMHGQQLLKDVDGDYAVIANPNNYPSEYFYSPNGTFDFDSSTEVLHIMTSDDFWGEYIGNISSKAQEEVIGKSMDTTFNVIRWTEENKKIAQKMGMYSGAVAPVATKPEDKKDSKGNNIYNVDMSPPKDPNKKFNLYTEVFGHKPKTNNDGTEVTK